MVSPIEVLKLRKENEELIATVEKLKLDLAQRDAEIEALKHMLDRKDEEQ